MNSSFATIGAGNPWPCSKPCSASELDASPPQLAIGRDGKTGAQFRSMRPSYQTHALAKPCGYGPQPLFPSPAFMILPSAFLKRVGYGLAALPIRKRRFRGLRFYTAHICWLVSNLLKISTIVGLRSVWWWTIFQSLPSRR